jgi:hypothetical protein
MTSASPPATIRADECRAGCLRIFDVYLMRITDS